MNIMIDCIYSEGQLKSVKKRFARRRQAISVGYKPSPLAMPAPKKGSDADFLRDLADLSVRVTVQR
jgi:hypothetical protein